MHRTRLAYCTLFLVGIMACSGPNQAGVAVSSATAGVVNVTAGSLYQAFASVPKTRATAIFGSLSQLSVRDYYAYAEQLRGSHTVAVDGQVVGSSFSSSASRAAIEALASRYGSIGDYWHGLGIHAPSDITQTMFLQGVQALAHGGASLSLGLLDDKPTNTFTRVASQHCDSVDSDLKSKTGAELGSMIAAANQAAQVLKSTVGGLPVAEGTGDFNSNNGGYTVHLQADTSGDGSNVGTVDQAVLNSLTVTQAGAGDTSMPADPSIAEGIKSCVKITNGGNATGGP